MDLAIRFADPDDVPSILAFIRELAEYERLAHEVVADEATLRASLFGVRPAAGAERREEIDDRSRPAAEILIAELAGEPVGFALFFQSYSTFLGKPGLYLEDLFVRPTARGRGVGAALMSACAGIARQRSYGRFEWSVLDWNEPALGFYRSMGARPLADWTVHRLTGAELAALADRWPYPVGRT